MTNLQEISSPSSHLPIALEAMGGDLGPKVVVEGAVRAWREFGLACLLVGDGEKLESMLSAQLGSDRSRAAIEVVHASEVVEMSDSASAAIRRKGDSSMRKAFRLVVEGRASCVLGPGNTGAMMATGIYDIGGLEGVIRPAIATTIPKASVSYPTIMLDSGANIDCSPEQLFQFALMGQVYASELFDRKSPRVGLLSNGAEASKGNDKIRQAAKLLEESSLVNYIGYVEGGDLASESVDVVVCDGFVGNVVLKVMEGAVKLVVESIRGLSSSAGLRGKLGLWLVKPLLRRVFKERLNPSTYGGAPLLGLRQLVLITHGSSDGEAIFNAMRMAGRLLEKDICRKLGAQLRASSGC